jgi:hypothetical protein
VAGGFPESIPEALAAAECIRSALAGLSFPCLAGSEVCPEFVCIE